MMRKTRLFFNTHNEAAAAKNCCHGMCNFIDRMPWPGDQNIMIDRFDVRASLDYIPDLKPHEKE